MKYMECKFASRRASSCLEVKIGDHTILQVTQFKYLESITENDGKLERDVKNRIQTTWMK